MVKKIHLSLNEVEEKIQKLTQEVQQQEIKANKTKRKRLYHQLANLRKAINEPEEFLVDPEIKLAKMKEEKEKRIQKKLEKKKKDILEKKKQNRYKKRCLRCGSKEHLLEECDRNVKSQGQYCYKCGSKDHKHKECGQESYKMANCFYCGKKGHIARECPENEKGLFRKGGSCFGCGSVRHTLKECPTRQGSGFYHNKEQF